MQPRRGSATAGLLAGTCLLLFLAAGGAARGALPTVNPADPRSIPKYVDPLPIPPVLQPRGITADGSTYYEVGMTQTRQKLHRDFPATTLWGYEGAVPGPTIAAQVGERVRVKWSNNLPDRHLLPVDRTLDGAGPDVPEVRTVAHLHGGHTGPGSDGFPEAWFSPGNAATGMDYTGNEYVYPNRQKATTLWYHDHAMGITRLNVYAGLAGFYILRDPDEAQLGLPAGQYEIPLLLQDKSFNPDGSLFFNTQPDEPVPGVDPSIVPEFFGNTNLVNGKVWPYLDVEPRKYRFRLLNGANARVYRLRLSSGQPFIQVGSDGGLLAAPLRVDALTLAPAERSDVVIDFAAMAGQSVTLTNDGATPFPSGDPVDPATTGQVMRFRVGRKVSTPDTSVVPAQLSTVKPVSAADAVQVRDIKLSEGTDMYGRLMPQLEDSVWSDPVQVTPLQGATEVWRLINVSEDTHPIHVHLVQFQVLDRQPFDLAHYEATGEIVFTGPAVPPDPNEQGWKDTVRANPGEVTRIIAEYADFAGRYVFHCHILDHEDHTMMRPFDVVPAPM